MPAETVSTAPSAVPEPAVIRTTTTGDAGKAKPARKAKSAGATAKTAGAASATGGTAAKGKAAGTKGKAGTGATAAGAAAKPAKGKNKAATAGTTSASAAAKPAKSKGKAATSSAAAGGKAKPAAKAAAASAGTPPTKPAPEGPLFTAPTGAKDKLTDIKGIGPVAERQLNEQGITTFAQIAALSAADIQRIDDYMPFSDRQIRDWQAQAKKKA
ncbi:50S ribosomal protein L21 [Roseitalea porphyridii]|uniref:50S ribosomal protein L21 n=2 Tax=Roseitalea porphyridii TaxID=1852022 RepID=A0A4P6V449_9HYPH|nr:50S ribosomal protein L21 [Roseitalea porphyridii]